MLVSLAAKTFVAAAARGKPFLYHVLQTPSHSIGVSVEHGSAIRSALGTSAAASPIGQRQSARAHLRAHRLVDAGYSNRAARASVACAALLGVCGRLGHANPFVSAFSRERSHCTVYVRHIAIRKIHVSSTPQSCIRLSGLSQARQCGDEVLRMLVTGGPPNLGGGGIPQRIVVSSVPLSVFRTTGAG